MAEVGDDNSRGEDFAGQRSRKAGGVQHPGMMGDETEEQSLNEEGDPDARIGEDELEEGFGASSVRLPRFWAGFATGVVAALAATRLLTRDW